MESSSDPDSDDALPKRVYQELLEAFRQRLCISINLTDDTKLDNGFTGLIDFAITHHYLTLEFLSTTGRTIFVEDMIRKYEHVIQRTIQNIETHDFWNMHCNNMLMLDRECHKRRGKGQANVQVSFEAAKRAPIDYYYRCKYTSVQTLALASILFSNFLLLVHKEFGPSFAWMGNLAALKAKLREVGYGGDEDMVVGAVIAPEVIVHLAAADMYIDYDAAFVAP